MTTDFASQPLTAESADRNKLYIFTPDEGVEMLDECIIICNNFAACYKRFEEGPVEAWKAVTITVALHFTKVMEFTLNLPDVEADKVDDKGIKAFSHFALSYKTGVCRIAAVKLQNTTWWYRTKP